MATDPKRVRIERFTMLEPKAPNNLTDEQRAWRSVELDACLPSERLTVLRGDAPRTPEVKRET